MMKLFTISEVKDRLNCSESHVYNLVSSGKLRCHRIGIGRGGIRVSESQFQQFLRETEEGGEEPPTSSLRKISYQR